MRSLNALDGFSRHLNNRNQNIVFASFFILFISALCFLWNVNEFTWPGIDNLPAATKFRIDYNVIESKFSSKFHQCKYVYKNNEFYIYTIKALFNCDGKARQKS